ncbi:MAG: GAF domain-containing protein, partial [Actinomycetota bacterium]|nr:GAF domain-containing protein [Actinomycetota bacterium]
MNYDMIDSRLLTAPYDPEVSQRLARLDELGLSGRPDPEFDEFATALAEAADAPYAMVNFVGERDQYFAGLHVPSTAKADALKAAQSSSRETPSRTMSRDHGYCPHVVARRKA